MYVLVHSSHISIQNPQSWGGVPVDWSYVCFLVSLMILLLFFFPSDFHVQENIFRKLWERVVELNILLHLLYPEVSQAQGSLRKVNSKLAGILQVEKSALAPEASVERKALRLGWVRERERWRKHSGNRVCAYWSNSAEPDSGSV